MSTGLTGSASSAAPAAGFPDVNAETFPAETVQLALDRVALFHFYAAPAPGSHRGHVLQASGGTELELHLDLHPFTSNVDVTAGLSSTAVASPPAGSYSSSWRFAAVGVPWSPGADPPPMAFDPQMAQGFVLSGDLVRFGERKRRGFSGYALGRTFPGVHRDAGLVALAAVGNLVQGFGKFRGLNATYVLNGVLSRSEGFRGDLTVRVPDPEGLFSTSEDLPEPESTDLPVDATYIAMLGRKASPRDRSGIGPSSGGGPSLAQLTTSAEMNSAHFRFSDGAGGLFVAAEAGPAIAALDATVTLDIKAPPGTADHPNPFTTRNVYQFRDAGGREVGTVEAELGFGLSFDLPFPDLPGQQGLRFGGAGEVVRTSGIFDGLRGVASVNSAIGIAPHVLSISHVLRLSGSDSAGGASSGAAPASPGRASHATAVPNNPVRTEKTMTSRVVERDLMLPIGARMHYRESGSPQGPPILMLHGNPGNSGAWGHVMDSLADVGRCIAPDLMGFGGSDKPRQPPSFYNQAEYLDQFVETLGLLDLTLFIQDWGGALGFDHAVRHRDNIRGIAFFESILKPYESWDTFPQQVDPSKVAKGDPQQSKSALARQKFQDFRQDETLGGSGWKQVTVDNVFLKVFMGPLLGHPFDPREIPEPENHPVLGPILAPYLAPFPTIWSRNPIWRLSREIPIAGSPADTVASIGHYSRVLADWGVPKLLIYSDKGPTLKEEHARWVRDNWGENLTVHNLDTLPGVEVVEGTHFLQQTHPDIIASLFRDWYLALG